MHLYFPKLTFHQDCGIHLVQNLIYYLFFDEKSIQIYLFISMPIKFVDLVEESWRNNLKLVYKANKCLISPVEVKWMTRIIVVLCFLSHLSSIGKYTQLLKKQISL